jgi:malate dehydrogenase (oxaloacetate-decarboxylating)
MIPKTSASYSITMRVQIQNRIGMLGRVTSAIGKAGGDIGAIDIAGFGKDTIIRDISVNARDEAHEKQIAAAVGKLPGVKVVNVSDRTFLMHLGGKISVNAKAPIKTRAVLSMVYTPGVARVCMAIHADPSKAHQLTIKKNTVAVITDGSAVLGLGNIGPAAALPVMEGKAALFKEFAGVDAFPICLDTQDPDEIVRTAKALAPVFGGINLEDISAPRCFEIEERLQKEVDIPVFHDDQHGTAVVVLAALLNALRIVKKQLRNLKIVVSGVGASGVACTKILMAMGARNIIGLDTKGALYRGRREHMNPMKEWFAQATNPQNLKGDILDVIKGTDMYLGLSGPGTLRSRV